MYADALAPHIPLQIPVKVIVQPVVRDIGQISRIGSELQTIGEGDLPGHADAQSLPGHIFKTDQLRTRKGGSRRTYGAIASRTCDLLTAGFEYVLIENGIADERSDLVIGLAQRIIAEIDHGIVDAAIIGRKRVVVGFEGWRLIKVLVIRTALERGADSDKAAQENVPRGIDAAEEFG